MKTTLICFDLWETLVTEPLTPVSCFKVLVDAYPHTVSWPKVRELIAQILHKKDQPTKRSIIEILEHFGVTDGTLASEITSQWEYSSDQVKLFPEVLEVLRYLREKGFKLGLVTNTSCYGWEATNKKFLLDSYFDYLALSFRLGRVKPEPEIFEFIERESGFSGGEITMVGDSYKNDFEAPRKRGWESSLVDRFETNVHPEAKPVVRSLLQLRDTLL